MTVPFLLRRVLLLLLVGVVGLALAQGEGGGLGDITAAIADAAAEAEAGILPAMVGFFGFLVTLGFAWAIVRSLRG